MLICSWHRSTPCCLQELLKEAGGGTDASGNPILGDIGKFLGGHIKKHFKEAGNDVDLKYIDPTYMVRAIPTIPSDHIYCKVLGQNAVHAAFAGYTGMHDLVPTTLGYRAWSVSAVHRLFLCRPHYRHAQHSSCVPAHPHSHFPRA